MEPLFGTVSPLWSAMPGQFGYGAAALAAGGRIVQGVQGTQTGQIPGDPFGNVMGATGIQAGGAIGFPAFAGSEIGIGITAPTLLTAVAMRRGQPLGPNNDQEIEDFIYDALDLLPGANDVEVRCEGGKAMVTGTVAHKRLKRDIGEIAWAIPSVVDVQNNITIAQRRRARRENEPTSVAQRKQA
jgi:BON domain-containing protein